MANTTSTSANLSLTVAHTISYLTRPLIASHSATAIIKLQSVLEANLTAYYAPSWVLEEPLHGSGRRCLTLSPDCLPPRPIYAACVASGVQWFEWISALGNRQFDLFVDPGCVSVRYGRKGTHNGMFITVWVDEIASPSAAKPYFEAIAAPKPQSKTFAQQLLEEDHEEDNQLFSMIAHEINGPAWTPLHANFPTSVRSLSPLSTNSAHSRSSSRSSNSSSTFSSSAASSTTSVSATSASGSKPKQSRRERARQARVFVDTSKTEVTPYDGGKTTVLTGGVMLGGGAGRPNLKMAKSANGAAASWRAFTA